MLGGATARRIIAAGESQSAERLSCYLLDAKPVDPVFDGFMIDHGECAGPTAGASTPFAYAPKVPTMFLDGMAESRPAMHNGPDLRVWQIAGASHVDAWIGAYGSAEHNWDDTGTPQGYSEQTAGNWGLEGGQGGVCNLFTTHDPVRADELPQQYTHDAAFSALQTWITSGRAPAATPPMQFDPKGTASPDGAGGGVDADRFGNPLGGLRLPQIQVPVAQYQGTCTNPEGQVLIGTTRPFTDAQLLAVYPTFASYRTKMCQASLADVEQGTLLPFDAQDIDRRVKLGRGRWPAGKQRDGTSTKACAALYATAKAPKKKKKARHRHRPPARHRRAARTRLHGLSRLGPIELGGDRDRRPLMGAVRGAERRDHVLPLPAHRRRIGHEQAPDLAPELLASHRVGQRRERVGAHPRALDERRDHRLPGQRRAAEHARVQHGRVERVRADQRAALGLR